MSMAFQNEIQIRKLIRLRNEHTQLLKDEIYRLRKENEELRAELEVLKPIQRGKL